jgi:hypothetical protein
MGARLIYMRTAAQGQDDGRAEEAGGGQHERDEEDILVFRIKMMSIAKSTQA